MPYASESKVRKTKIKRKFRVCINCELTLLSPILTLVWVV
jgi:hypothetical protein